VTWYRVVRENGQVVSREPIHTHYTAIAETVLVGTKPRRPKAPRPLAPTTIPATPATSATAPPVAPDTQRSQQ
jgi:hypothetical protein